MAFTITLGSVSISINPAALLNPVIAHPSSTSAVYATFVENVVESGLVKTVFDAFIPVINKDTPGSAKVPWPARYGTTDEPYGTPADHVTGVQAVALVDDGSNVRRWTNAVHTAASSRKSWLDHYAELALAVATGIKNALETHVRTGRVTVPASPGGGVPGAVTVSVSNMAGEVFLTTRSEGSAWVASQDGTSFTLNQMLATPLEVSWLVVG